MDRLNYNHLFYFYVTAKEGSIKEASQKLYLSQPTISDQIKVLEDYFECKLFERKSRSLFLTQEGKEALEYCEKIFSLGYELTTKLRKNLNTPKTSIEIGLSPYMSQYFLFDHILPLINDSSVSVNLIEKKRRYLLADLDDEKIDIVFTDNKENIGSNMDAYRVGVNKTFVLAHKKIRKKNFSFPADLNSIAFFNYTRSSFFKYEIELFFRKNRLNPKVIGTGDDIDLLQLVTSQAKAFTIVPEVAAKRFMLDKDIVLLGEIEDFQTSVWGIIKCNNKGPAFKFLNEKFNFMDKK